jgi:hypothetical protein
LETLGTLVAKALARRHGVPAFAVLALARLPAGGIVSAVRIVGAVAEGEAVGTILSLLAPESLLDVTSSNATH